MSREAGAADLESAKVPQPEVIEFDQRKIAERILGRADGNTATVTKADLIETVTAAAGVTKRAAEEIVNATLAAMVESLQAGESIEIRGFGSFGIRHRGPRTGRNPKTGVAVDVPAKRIVGPSSPAGGSNPSRLVPRPTERPPEQRPPF